MKLSLFFASFDLQYCEIYLLLEETIFILINIILALGQQIFYISSSTINEKKFALQSHYANFI